MDENSEKFEALYKRIEALLKKQEDFTSEILSIKAELASLKNLGNQPTAISATEKNVDIVNKSTTDIPLTESKSQVHKSVNVSKKIEVKYPTQKIESETPTKKIKKHKQINIEKFIGENLLSKLGILLLVVGVFIGVKYAINHELITPLTRIVLGYIMGGALLFIAIKLKKKYFNYSAVLLSGSVAVLYFITFAAYSLYGLIPYGIAFPIMLLITIFTVVASLYFTLPIIANLGLVGAYAIPFLLYNGLGNPTILYSYIAIINTGILVISFKKYWKSLYYCSFIATWIIYINVYINQNPTLNIKFSTAFLFLLVFFITFYAIFLSYKLLKNEKFRTFDVVFLLANSFIFYFLGRILIRENYLLIQTTNLSTSNYFALFTLFNAVIHFLVSVIIYRKKLADIRLFHLVAGLVLVFITITIPILFDRLWVSLLWAMESALLFWIGRTKKVLFYEKISYILQCLAFFSWAFDMDDSNDDLLIFKNLAFCIFLGLINYFNYKIPATSTLQKSKQHFVGLMSIVTPALLLITLYKTFYNVIDNLWIKNSNDVYVTDYVSYNLYPIIHLLTKISLSIYTLFFMSIVGFINFKKIKNEILANFSITITLGTLLYYLSGTLIDFNELLIQYQNPEYINYLTLGDIVILRYFSFVGVAFAVMMIYQQLKKVLFIEKKNYVFLSIPFNILLLSIIISEYIFWMDVIGASNAYRYGLSILCALYALSMIIWGIWKKNKTIRFEAFAILGVVVLKVILYDGQHLSSIAKTLLFIIIGILLLIISFLYYKYKSKIGNETEK